MGISEERISILQGEQAPQELSATTKPLMCVIAALCRDHAVAVKEQLNIQ
jgi:hypothetical protein